MDISSLVDCTKSTPHSCKAAATIPLHAHNKANSAAVTLWTIGELVVTIPKTRKEYNDIDCKSIEKNLRANKILICGIGPDEYNRISACQSTKEIWEALQAAHEGTTQVKQSKIDMLTTEYELLRMKDDESIQDMHTRFTSIINELHSLGEIIPRNKLVRKILNVLPGSWESKVNAITEAKDLQNLTIDELIRNLKTCEMKKKKDHERRDPKKEKNMVLKTDNNDSSGEDADIAYLTKQFQKRALAAWGGSSNESAEVDEQGDSSIFALMVEADEDEEDDDDNEKKLISLRNVLFDAYHNLINDKNALTVELREIENERDDPVVVVVNLKKTIESLKKEKDTLDKRITNIEHETDDLLVVVVNLKETIKELKRKSRHETTQKGKEVTRTSEGKQPKMATKVEFVSKICTVTNLVTSEVILMAKRYKNIYVADFESLHNGDLTCLSVVDDDVEPWHRRLGHASFTLLNKLVKKDLVRGLPKSSFKDHKVCDACVKGKQIRTKDETFLVFVAFVKKIQVKMSHIIVNIRSDHGTEFDNAKFDEFYAENGFWAEAINIACYLVNRCMIRSLLNKTLDEGILLRYSSQSKAYKVYNRRTQYIEESIHVIFDESYHLFGRAAHDKADQDGELSNVPGEVIDMANGKADIMIQVKESNENGTGKSSADVEEPGSSITITEAENRVVDVVQGTLDAEVISRTHESYPEEPRSSHNEIRVSNWKHKSSHPLQNVITPLDSGTQTRSKSRNSLSFSALKDADWITAMQDKLHQFKRNNVWHLVPRPADRTVIGTRWIFRNKLDEFGNTTRNKIRLVVQGYNQEEGIDYDKTFVFVKQPPGFECHEHPEHVFKLEKGRNLLIVQVYVDDIIFGATNDSLCEEFSKLMGSEFEMSMMGELNFFLGLQVKQTQRGT
ncbi:uncharacterized protein LOC142166047 [Nicotiana tabacum]|uniref:Uncharacterized protein LOC142166047 n=1 Tax=Nicotiana tabacum TaxID=4097 RepID=A0AC58S6P8_TOBAC